MIYRLSPRQKLAWDAPCLDSSRFSRSRPEAHAVSCVVMQYFARGQFWPSPMRNFQLESAWISHKCTVSGLESIRAYCFVLSALAGWLNCQECEWGLSPLGSSGLSDFSTDATHKTFGLIPTSRTLSGVRTLAYGT